MVDKGHLDRAPGGLLDRFDQVTDLRALLLIGSGDSQSQKVTESVHGDILWRYGP